VASIVFIFSVTPGIGDGLCACRRIVHNDSSFGLQRAVTYIILHKHWHLCRNEPQKIHRRHNHSTLCGQRQRCWFRIAFLLSSRIFVTTSLHHCLLRGQRRRFHLDRIIFFMFLKTLLLRNYGKDTVFLSRQQSRGNSWTLLIQLFQHQSFHLRLAQFQD
jgi:hypothetical protein